MDDRYSATSTNYLLNFKADKSTTTDLQTQISANTSNTYTKFNTDLLLWFKADKTTTNDLQTQITSANRDILDCFQEFPTKAIGYNYWNPTALTYTQDNITISVSSILPSYYTAISGSQAVDDVTGSQQGWMSDDAWFSSGTVWISGDFIYKKIGPSQNLSKQLFRTKVDGNLIGRQWFSIDCGTLKNFVGFKLHFKEANNSANFKDYHVAGSNDNINFTSIYHTLDEDYSNGKIIAKKLSYETNYRYYRLVINDIVNPFYRNNVGLQEFTFLQKFDIEQSTTNVDLNKLINIMNGWIRNGNLYTQSGLQHLQDPIRSSW
jgi:hypothetical protein